LATVINASAYTAVDAAETPEGRQNAWATNVSGVSELAKYCSAHSVTLLHASSDYVFDGTKQGEYIETDVLCPLGVYGQTKAAGDAAVATTSRHYILRTSWVIGEGNNFVRTMASLAEKGINPCVVNDQIGRLTFTADLASAIRHLLESKAPYGVYNMTNSGEPASWADIAQKVFELTGHDANRVTGVTTVDYYSGKECIAPRPLNSVLSLSKLEQTGFSPVPWEERLAGYLSN
jgi:dTDP-4-dehydrorhamnose 3,5-epimerase